MPLPLIDGYEPSQPVERKPLWRGWIHTGLTPLVIASGIVLICLAPTTLGKWASAVFMLCSLLLFGNSAVYHRFNWKPKNKAILRRVDHANIFLLIAGTYTPIALLALPWSKGSLLLILVWSGAILGIGFRVFWLGAPRWLYVLLYLVLGWAAMMYIVDLLNANLAMMILVLAGGLCYTVGAVFYAIKKPDHGIFGYHEVFHALTAVAYMCHWTAILLIALAPVSAG